MKSASLLFAFAVVLGISGCTRAFGDVRPYAPLAPIQPVVANAATPTQGAIYRAGPSLDLYADQRARDVGDLLTIDLVENTMAQTTATTSVDKSSDISMSAPEIAGAALTYNGRDLLSASVSGDRGFAGNGKSAQSNRLVGSLTVTVVQRLPNGNLVVQGQKNMRLNQGDELVQIQGIVRPADIRTDNSVPSSRVAEARIAYGGRGALAQSNSMGWLSRFFNSPIYPN
ncbi:flagellar basal body L-ring protein FlgH [Pseudoxanthomonas dokdonensis]|uniref:Flagellar L-ring protein n=1 Tax=Pseudoxanthomonas dokdonensis TaxID=344882 RepID=A0A0R0D071_9GAMM|nr:flagellar basal body L-ring protein FlgH [Pseudoxanthomonas dokdonensis]KRG71011.1 flagellar basal body L-ring protein [Pseudoxanthomonas dokdonensis]